MDSRSGLIFCALENWSLNGFGLADATLVCLYRRLLLLMFFYSLLLGLRSAVRGSRNELLESLFFAWPHNLLRLRQVILSDCKICIRVIPVIVLDHNQSVDMWILIGGASSTL